MSYGKAEERSSSRHRSPSTARHAATSAILTDILSRSDRAPTSSTVDARPGKSILIVPERVVGHLENRHVGAKRDALSGWRVIQVQCASAASAKKRHLRSMLSCADSGAHHC